jgi:hypothetical protein
MLGAGPRVGGNNPSVAAIWPAAAPQAAQNFAPGFSAAPHDPQNAINQTRL